MDMKKELVHGRPNRRALRESAVPPTLTVAMGAAGVLVGLAMSLRLSMGITDGQGFMLCMFPQCTAASLTGAIAFGAPHRPGWRSSILGRAAASCAAGTLTAAAAWGIQTSGLLPFATWGGAGWPPVMAATASTALMWGIVSSSASVMTDDSPAWAQDLALAAASLLPPLVAFSRGTGMRVAFADSLFDPHALVIAAAGCLALCLALELWGRRK